MNCEIATSLIPDPPTTHKWLQVEGYFEVNPKGSANSSGSRIQQRDLVPVSRNSRIHQDYIDYVHASMQLWGIGQFTMDWEKHHDD
jgi:hypothetical protein